MRLEHARQQICRNTGTIIANADFDVLLGASGCHRDHAITVERVASVFKKVDQHFLQFCAATEHLRQIRLDLFAILNFRITSPIERDRLTNNLFD